MLSSPVKPPLLRHLQQQRGSLNPGLKKPPAALWKMQELLGALPFGQVGGLMLRVLPKGKRPWRDLQAEGNSPRRDA